LNTLTPESIMTNHHKELESILGSVYGMIGKQLISSTPLMTYFQLQHLIM